MRAQVQTQIFTYILAVVIAALILGFGYYWFKEIPRRACLQETAQAGANIKSQIGMVKYGDMKTVKIPISCGFSEACFVDVEKPANEELSNKPVIYSSWRNVDDRNFFFYPNGADSFNLGKITIDDQRGFVCMPIANNLLTFRATGMGTSVKISAVK
jgi:hypothetical protein